MTKSELLHLKNDMLGANFLANLIGVLSTKIFLLKTEGPLPDQILLNPIFNFIDAVFAPAAFIFVGGMTLIYERPIRSYLNAKFKKKPVPLILEHNAQQKLLNEPFILIALSFSMWLLSAILYPVMYWIIFNARSYWIQRSCFLSLSTGLITITVAFFLLEYVF